MANITATVTIDQFNILEVDANPGSGGGTAAPIGSIAVYNSGSAALAYLKTGSTNTGWDQFVNLSLASQAVFGATNLTTVGAIPYVTGAGQLNQDANLNWSTANKELTIGPASTAALANNYFSVNANVNSYIQANVQNLNAGTLASGDIVATADNGSDASNYVNLGINSSGNTDASFSIAGAGDSYLSANGGKLVIGTETANDVRFYTGGPLAANEKMRIDSTMGVVLVGNPTAPIDITGAGAYPIFQIVGTTAVQMANITYSNDTIPSVVNLLKSRGATIGTQTILQSGDEIGRVQFRGSDGASFQAAGALRVQVDLTPSAGSMPGRLNLWTTAAGSITPTERLRIDSTGFTTAYGFLYASNGFRLSDTADATNGNLRFQQNLDVGFYRGYWHNLSFSKELFDDFQWTTIGGTANQFGVQSTVANGGAVTASTTTGAAFSGLLAIASGTTNSATGVAAAEFFGGTSKISCGTLPLSFEWRVQIPVLSTTGVGYQVRIGTQDTAATGDPVNGIYFTYTQTLNAGVWVATTRSASTSTNVVSTVTVAINTWYKLRAEVNAAATQCDFYIDSGSGQVLIGSSTSNIPTAGTRLMAKINKTTSTTTSSVLNADYCLWNQER